jgi:hypothetical protein
LRQALNIGADVLPSINASPIGFWLAHPLNQGFVGVKRRSNGAIEIDGWSDLANPWQRNGPASDQEPIEQIRQLVQDCSDVLGRQF